MTGFPEPPPDPWRFLAARTPARIALGRAGGSLPTRALLDFQAAHAAAVDAVHAPFHAEALAEALQRHSIETVMAQSLVNDRPEYLRRPDRGRLLAPASEATLRALADAAGPFDVAFIVSDGLSAPAAMRQAPATLAALVPVLRVAGLRLSPVVIVANGRVALQDPIGAALGAKVALMLIGERPGLTAPDSLGAYLVFGPAPGNTDARRNCVSNIRPEGLAPTAAAEVLRWLVVESLRRRLSGVALKDDRHLVVQAPTPPAEREGVPQVP